MNKKIRLYSDSHKNRRICQKFLLVFLFYRVAIGKLPLILNPLIVKKALSSTVQKRVAPAFSQIHARNRILRGDFIERMSRFPANSVDLIVTDPLYQHLRHTA